MIKSVLLDARSPQGLWDQCIAEMQAATLVGVDCETQDEARHPGLQAYNTKTKHVFDHRRTTMTGYSLYADGSDIAWYINLAHADVENRVDALRGLEPLHAVNPVAIKAAHNAPFELVMFHQCHGIDLTNIVCTLQLAVTHHGPDEYDLERFRREPLSGFARIARAAEMAFVGYDGGALNGDQSEMLGKFIAKESKAEHSYNGFVKSIATGFNLKRLTKSRFGVEQMEFQKLLDQFGAKHMGELTGEQTVAYGADDAYWAVQHYKWMRDDLLANNPQALVAFIKTENPMVQVFAEAWREGIRLDLEQVFERQRLERIEMAKTLREFKALLRRALPFPEEPNEKLMERQAKWYASGWLKKRTQLEAWANSPDDIDDFRQCFQVSNPVGNAWAAEKGQKVPSGKLNLVYYQTLRVIVHDLLGHRLVYDKGEVSSDKEARGKMVDTFKSQGNDLALAIMTGLQKMADIEQRMKLYLTPYTQLMDPETSRIYPVLSAMLATRRMAARDPNDMQLAKQGESAYIRGFYLGDDDDEVVVSADWSSVELVLVGDRSGDPEFGKVFGQLPYGDLHSGAAADCLAVKTLPGLTEAEYMEFKYGRNPNNRELLHIVTGQPQEPADFYKYTRGTPVGKGANFSYWYSGALSSVAQTLGWSDTEMWDAVDRYRQRFAIAEAWRVSVGAQATETGFITLPDGHRRVRVEATGWWYKEMMDKFMSISASEAMQHYARLALKRIQGRARNQAVNAEIQGTCAALAKRSILRMRELVKDAGIADQQRFMMPIHDELVYSVKKSVVVPFIKLLRQAMCEHPEIVTTLPLSCSVAIGRTFRPFNKANPQFSQIELDEASPIAGVIPAEMEGKALNDDQIEAVLEYMFHTPVAKAA